MEAMELLDVDWVGVVGEELLDVDWVGVVGVLDVDWVGVVGVLDVDVDWEGSGVEGSEVGGSMGLRSLSSGLIAALISSMLA